MYQKWDLSVLLPFDKSDGVRLTSFGEILWYSSAWRTSAHKEIQTFHKGIYY